MSSPMLHRLHNGSNVRVINAKDFIKIPIWNGNRIKSPEHIKRISDKVKDNITSLDFGYHIVTRMIEDADGNNVTETLVVDGQHRHQVLLEYFNQHVCEPDFPIIVVEKEVEDESDIIAYFNTINTQNPISWKSDPKLIANKYLDALLKTFNDKGKKNIREKPTKRPYIFVEQIRKELCELCKKDVGEGKEEIDRFIRRVSEYNTRLLSEVKLSSLWLDAEKEKLIAKAKELKFILGIDPKLPWISSCLLG